MVPHCPEPDRGVLGQDHIEPVVDRLQLLGRHLEPYIHDPAGVVGRRGHHHRIDVNTDTLPERRGQGRQLLTPAGSQVQDPGISGQVAAHNVRVLRRDRLTTDRHPGEVPPTARTDSRGELRQFIGAIPDLHRHATPPQTTSPG